MGVNAVIKYPEKLPCFLLHDKTARPVDGGVNTELPNGAMYRRFGFMATPVYHEVSWNLTAEQAHLLDSWYRYTLHHGTEWFEVRLHQPRGDKKVLLQFAEVFQGCHKVAPDLYKASATLVQWQSSATDSSGAGYWVTDEIVRIGIVEPAVRLGSTGRYADDSISIMLTTPAIRIGDSGRWVSDGFTLSILPPAVNIGGKAFMNNKEIVRISLLKPDLRIGT